MLRFLIIIAAWITPGIVLFLYLLWISKRHNGEGAQVELPLAKSSGPPIPKVDAQQSELPPPIEAKSHRRFPALKRFG
ncbi:MAG TPA: hypothetical protein VMZ30_10875 [Pyrinomonadaceae bacterium]|nr:hypothetical protein [Pyrinomonadaceae bacterium]